MLDMCKYNMASQHDSMTQVFHLIGSKERDITTHGSLDPTFRAYKSKHMRKLNMSEYRHL